MSEWKPIESAPKDGTEVLLAYPGGIVKSGKWTLFGGYYEEHWADGERPRFGADPTHWMPLPPPPSV
jgi:hypothetical protein